MMLSELTQDEKREVVFNAYAIEEAVKIIASFSNETNEIILAKIAKATEARIQEKSDADINEIIAYYDKVRTALISQTDRQTNVFVSINNKFEPMQ